jgi:hypothetical protein
LQLVLGATKSDHYCIEQEVEVAGMYRASPLQFGQFLDVPSQRIASPIADIAS